MKSAACRTALLIGAAFWAQSSWAILITTGPYMGTDPGAIDMFIAEAAKAGNPVAETAWVNSILGAGTVTFQVKNESVSYYSTDLADVFAFTMDAPYSQYFLIKNAQRMALYSNLDSLGYGVFDTDDLSSAMKLGTEGYQISHVTRFNPLNVSVPEPATLGLLGASLLGLGLGRRRKRA